jgi:hypothetical protein
MKTAKLGLLLALLFTGVTLHAQQIKIDKSQMAHLPKVSANGNLVPTLDFPAKPHLLTIDLHENQSDWSKKDFITLRLFRPSGESTRMVVILRAKADTKGSDEFPSVYWWKIIQADWQGWKDMTISLKEFSKARTTEEPGQVVQILFRNQFGPEKESWGIPQPVQAAWGIGQIVVE